MISAVVLTYLRESGHAVGVLHMCIHKSSHIQLRPRYERCTNGREEHRGAVDTANPTFPNKVQVWKGAQSVGNVRIPVALTHLSFNYIEKRKDSLQNYCSM
jgi:hypothetical protein